MPTWLTEKSLALSATAEGAAWWGGEGVLNTACRVALLHVSHTDSVRAGESYSATCRQLSPGRNQPGGAALGPWTTPVERIVW